MREIIVKTLGMVLAWGTIWSILLAIKHYHGFENALLLVLCIIAIYTNNNK